MLSSLSAAAAIVQSFLGSTLPVQTSQYNGPIAQGGAWRDAFLQADAMVGNMTLEERVNLTTAVFGPCPSNSGGVPRLGIPGMCFDDGREWASATMWVVSDSSGRPQVHRFRHAVALSIHRCRFIRQRAHA